MHSCIVCQVRIICRKLVGEIHLNSLKNKAQCIWRDKGSISKSKKGIKMKRNKDKKKQHLFSMLTVIIKNRQRGISNSSK